MASRRLLLFIPLIALVGCHKSGPGNDQRSASGQVLQGTASDAMIPLAQLTSQPPLLQPSKHPTTPEGAADQGKSDSGVADVSSEATGEAAPAATPAPAASSAP